ncbi:MAG: sensor histidine kinase, partial [Thermoleophilaceae bacterium]|nr:sensor histidine kinase [Thermoleophilaceae bacterium]
DKAIAVALEELQACESIASAAAVDLTTPTPQIIASDGNLTVEQIIAAHEAPESVVEKGLLVLPVVVHQQPEALIAVKSIENVPTPDREMFLGIAAAVGASASHLQADSTVETILRDTTKQLIQAQERDRATVAADIHDGTLQQLGATAMRLELIRTRVATNDPDAVNELIDSCAAEIRTCTKDLRTLLMELRPQVLDDNGLEAALRELGNGVKNVAVSVNYSLPDNPPDVLAITAFRIVQEALNNVRKHSHATTASVDVSEVNAEIRIEIRDDGVGFEGAASGPSSTGQHFGLLGMRDRARMLGGEFSIVGKKGAGTVVTATLPDVKDN